MSFIKKILIIVFFLIPVSNSFGAMVTSVQNETFEDLGREINGIHFNKDGTKVFTSYSFQPLAAPKDHHFINEYNLSTPYDISTRTYAGNNERCETGSGSDGTETQFIHDLEFSSDGMKLFTTTRGNDGDVVYRFDLTSPYDISTCTYISETIDLDSDNTLQNGSNAGTRSSTDDNRLQGMEINENGTKLFLVYHGAGSEKPRLLEYQLSTPYDLATISLVTSAGIALDGQGVVNPNTMRFSANGKRIFIISHSNGDQAVTQISLNVAYNTSAFTIDGTVSLIPFLRATGKDEPRGIAFNSSGLKMYIGDDTAQEIYEFDLVCPFNIIEGKCPSITENSDRTGMAIAQIEIAKRTIDQSTDTALNRLKWIRRNKDKQNLTNLNIDINFTNQMLTSLTKAVKTSAAKKDKENKDQDVFYWSEGSIAVGRIGDTSIASTRKIGTEAITVGADKFTNNNGIKGLAFRVGRNDVDIGSAGSNLDTDTYNLTYYTTSPVEGDTKFIDTVVGIGKLSSDLLTVLDGKNLTADRTGEQIYGTIRIKDEIKRNNLTLIPSGRFDIGHTILGSYKESGTGAIDVKKQHIRSKKIRLGIAAVEDLSNDRYTFKRHGKLEYVADIDRYSNFKYTYVGDNSVNFDDRLKSGALHNLNSEIGIDIIMPENFSIFIIYERNQALKKGHTDKIHIAIGYLPNKKTNFAFKIDGVDDLKSNYIVSKNINDFIIDFRLTNDLMRPEDYEEASVNLSRKF
tara:strand:+ start:1262 stop:3487 length:2226 start_codon:yes stop_codon:yes gene_type:complete